MSVNAVGSSSTYTNYEAPEAKSAAKSDAAATSAKAEAGVVYEKSAAAAKSPTYSINKMSAEDRANFVQKLKESQAAQEQNFLNMVSKVFQGQAKSFSVAMGDENMWKMLASGKFEVDAATKAQAQKDIGEDGYWGVNQTAQRLFDFASALAGDDEEQMKKMQAAMEKGFKKALGAWGRDLPEISNNTLKKANELFDDYYNSKKNTAAVVE